MPEVNHTSITDSIIIFGDGLHLSGTMKLSGMSRIALQNQLFQLSKDKKAALAKYLINLGNNNVKIVSLDVPAYNSTDSLFTIRYKIELTNALVKAGNDFLLKINYRDDFNILKITKPRFYKYSLDERSVKEHLIYIHIPPHLKVKNIPAPIEIIREGYCFSGAYQCEERSITLMKKFVISDQIIIPENFDTWNASVDQFQNFNREMIILTLN